MWTRYRVKWKREYRKRKRAERLFMDVQGKLRKAQEIIVQQNDTIDKLERRLSTHENYKPTHSLFVP